jgi:nucleotide-binding universal stress UspA family protein
MWKGVKALYGETVEELKKHLQGFCKKVEAQIGPPCVELVSRILVPRGHPPEEILNAADEEGCDVIVLGTHGKGFLAHTFLGSVSNAVLHRTRKPVFIIPLPSEKLLLNGMESDRTIFNPKIKAEPEMALPFYAHFYQ